MLLLPDLTRFSFIQDALTERPQNKSKAVIFPFPALPPPTSFFQVFRNMLYCYTQDAAGSLPAFVSS